MHADDLIYALKKLGWSQVALARSLAVDTCTINNVIHGRTKSRRLASYIASQIDMTAEEIWPQIYRSEDRTTKATGEIYMSP
jgi:lambda repressor-like predicted transcriptional regulator